MVGPAGAQPKRLVAGALGFWDHQDPVRDSHCCQAATQVHQGLAAHSEREKVQSPLSPRRHLKAHHAKALGPMPPVHRDLTTAHHSVHHTAFCLVLQASWWLTLTLHRPPWGPSQVAWCCSNGVRDSQAPVPYSPCRQATTRVNRGPATHSGWEKGQGTVSNGNIHRPLVLKPLCPCYPCPKSSFQPTTQHAPQPLAHICGPPGG